MTRAPAGARGGDRPGRDGLCAIVGDSSKKVIPCQKYPGNNTGREPGTNGSGPDGTYCKYASSDITYE
ncbi:hypothetical protein GCM10010503_19780 [Streptomyces lucensis JCM 4490]|uniref:Uncharacterized protein n=1 Tax=Streptomyces lucensis JCM 4490 TaxID=1306176 RepID=A0A918MP12_9ACTN|nr:hypothetical protein GCM10010503_19780 [Streptomyces lucensis JCM 4490]